MLILEVFIIYFLRNILILPGLLETSWLGSGEELIFIVSSFRSFVYNDFDSVDFGKLERKKNK